jgi:PadR family transcriptional regulator, regulatory protein PadR
VSENNRRARYYQLTPAGRRQLHLEAATWRRYAEAVFKVLDPVPV